MRRPSSPLATALATALTALAAVALAASAAAASAAAPTRTVPPALIGMQAWADPTADDLRRMRSAGVRFLRDNVSWSVVEPTRGQRLWERYDAVFEHAARAGIEVAPVLVGSPAFAAPIPQYPPRAGRRAAFARFVRDAVARYGRGGTFWRERPWLRARPATTWQVWNEPNLGVWWYGRPDVDDYLTLVRQVRRAVRSRDRAARIVLAGMPVTKRDTRAPHFLRQIYRRPGARRLFDVVAVHAFAASAAEAVAVVRRTRSIMRAARDADKPLWVTELGWGSRPGATPAHLSTDEQTQAARLTAAFARLSAQRRRLRLERVFWFAWQDRALARGESDWWAVHSGLFRVDGSPKPAWRAFSRLTRR